MTNNNRFQFIGGSLALDFVNTVGNRLDPSTRRDYFHSIVDFIDWASAARAEPSLAANGSSRAPRMRDNDLAKVRDLRERLYRIFSARVDRRAPAPADLAALNDATRDVRRRQHIVRAKEGYTWAWDASLRPVDRALGVLVLDAASLLTSSQQTRIRRCRDRDCGWLFLDQSRGGRRRWCSMADCGNRNKARRHYQRQRGQVSTVDKR